MPHSETSPRIYVLGLGSIGTFTEHALSKIPALQPLQYRRNSAILFLQDGNGTINELNPFLFPDPANGPNYFTGVISDGVTLTQPFHATHKGFASISPGLLPRPGCAPEPNSQYLLDILPLSPRLNATSYPYTEVLQIQLEKLAVNALCNPLCAPNDAPNGFLFSISETRKGILTEISKAVLVLPELRGVGGVREQFVVERLEVTVKTILVKTAESTCPMVRNLRAERETE
ncbi:hypothetical protein ETB97_002893, partial [Aspergillus alliaceus]